MKTKTAQSIRAMCECSIMIALATVLSLIKLIDLPCGGSVTVASMLPILVLSYRRELPWALGSALISSVIQLLLGLGTVSYFTTWQSILALIILDYLLAFFVFCIPVLVRKIVKNQCYALVSSALIACLVRYACHVISGATIWAGLSIPTEAVLIYSFSYNATYMIPETIILVTVTAYIGAALDFSRDIPIRVSRAGRHDKVASVLDLCAGGAVLAGIVTDTVLVFSKLQDAESGEFRITNLQAVNFTAVIIVSAACALLALCLWLVARYRRKNAKN
jgi:thiamine transporter